MDLELHDVRKKLAEARTVLPGMPPAFYLLTDYMSACANNTLIPQGLVMFTIGVRDDLQKGESGYNVVFSEELAKRRVFAMREIRWLPQLIDKIADEQFALEFRKCWKEAFNSAPPVRIDPTTIQMDISAAPKYTLVATNWWANAILSPACNLEVLPETLLFALAAGTEKFTVQMIKTFMEMLAVSIDAYVYLHGSCSLSVSYKPCQILENAGRYIGLSDYDYPLNTSMSITDKKISVSTGSTAEVIWVA